MQEMPEDIRIGDYLIRSGTITRDQLEEALEIQKDLGGKLGKILVKLGFVSEEALFKHLSEQLDVDIVRLSGRKISPALFRMIPESTIRGKKVVPVSLAGGVLTVAMAYPQDLGTLEEIRFETGENVAAVLASESEIEEAITTYLGPASDETEKKEELVLDTPSPIIEDAPTSPAAVKEAAEAVVAQEARESLLRYPTRVKIDALVTALLDAGIIDEDALGRAIRERTKTE